MKVVQRRVALGGEKEEKGEEKKRKEADRRQIKSEERKERGSNEGNVTQLKRNSQ